MQSKASQAKPKADAEPYKLRLIPFSRIQKRKKINTEVHRSKRKKKGSEAFMVVLMSPIRSPCTSHHEHFRLVP